MLSNIIFTAIMFVLTVTASVYCGIKDGEEERENRKKDILNAK